MRREFRLVSGLAFSFAFSASIGSAQSDKRLPETIANWAAPPYWRLPAAIDAAGARPIGTSDALGGVQPITPPLPFVGLFPCRVADTRGNGFTGQAGPPTVLANVVRTFKIADPVPGGSECGVPATARAVSFQFTVTTMASNGNLIAWPEGAVPTASVLNWNASSVAIGNGIVVPISATGNLNVQINAPLGQAANLIIDVNGYYGPQKNVLPSDFLLHNASFQATVDTLTGTTKTVNDGFLSLSTGTTMNSLGDVSPQIGNGVTDGLGLVGAYMSARARWNSTIAAPHVFYILGGGSTGGTPLQNGFGFKAVGTALKGVTILNGTETVVDLATTLSTGTFRSLLAVRRETTVEFIVDGGSKGSTGANLPSGSNGTYEVRVTNGTTTTQATADVAFLTVGIPMF
jgi:hypothetical protein